MPLFGVGIKLKTNDKSNELEQIEGKWTLKNDEK